MEISDILSRAIEIWPAWFVVLGIVALNVWYYRKAQKCKNCSF
jgi:hypothetical protein